MLITCNNLYCSKLSIIITDVLDLPGTIIYAYVAGADAFLGTKKSHSFVQSFSVLG